METTTEQYFIERRKECLLHYNNFSYTNGTFCEAAWDGLNCWPPVLAGEIVTRSCNSIFPEIFTENKDPVAYRICNYTGQWLWKNWTNYSECLALFSEKEPKGRLSVSYILFIGSLLSLILLAITLFIFTYFKSLQCSRIRVHRNLVVALMIHSFLLIIIPLPILFENVVPSYHDFDWFCKTLLTLKMYASTASVNWMFIEGLLLYSSISIFVFQQDPPFKLYYFIGWGVSGIFVMSWTIFMILYLKTPCWKGYGRLPYIWIITGPMITVLVLMYHSSLGEHYLPFHHSSYLDYQNTCNCIDRNKASQESSKSNNFIISLIRNNSFVILHKSTRRRLFRTSLYDYKCSFTIMPGYFRVGAILFS